MNPNFIKFLPWLPAMGAVVCGVCCIWPAARKAAGPISVLSILGAFIMALTAYPGIVGAQSDWTVVHLFPWLVVGDFTANFSYFLDPLTMVMLLVVCGIGTLVALYAIGYMKGERGYARFFFGVSLFIFAMTNLVMADNLVLLFLGWEGVGLCSYLLIGYYYEKPSAAAAAKKAFIVNRVGDVGFAIGVFLTYNTFGTVEFADLFPATQAMAGEGGTVPVAAQVIPFLFMLGAFGKSAQIPLHVWLPDAMEGPTPVSALIHAATMVTAGVYLIARLFPLFELSPWALPVVGIVGALTATFAATIALCQYDIKRIWAYSTVSQLGYMFLGLGALTTIGAVFHLVTHAFFKALLFLTAGSVMHAMAGQLDLRRMSGLRHKMPVTCWLMFIGALALAGFPVVTSGFWSKDLILGRALERGLGEGVGAGPAGLYMALAILGIITAFLTAFYAFRLWFRVFWGPEEYEMGEEHHAIEELDPGHPHVAEEQAGLEAEHAPAHAAAEHGAHEEHAGRAPHEPHEMPWWPMNAPLLVLALGAIAAGFVVFTGYAHEGWIGWMLEHSTAALGQHAEPATEAAAAGVAEAGAEGGLSVHLFMQILSGVLAILGIAAAWFFHLKNRRATEKVASAFRPVVTFFAGKWYVDELYDRVIVQPLRGLGYGFYVFDQLVINGLVLAVGWIPRLGGRALRPSQSGRIQGYGVGMAFGIAALVLLVITALFQG